MACTAMSPVAQFEPDVRADDSRAAPVCVIGDTEHSTGRNGSG